MVGINAKLGFRFLDTTTALIPNIPWPSWPGRDVISSDPELIFLSHPAPVEVLV